MFQKLKTNKEIIGNNITGIININTPLQGASAARLGQDLNELISSLVEVIGHHNQELAGILQHANLLMEAGIKAKYMTPTVQVDFASNSEVVKNIRSTSQTIDIPVLLIGGKVNAVPTGISDTMEFMLGGYIPRIGDSINRVLSNCSLEDKAQLAKSFNKYLGGNEEELNDGFIPLTSQLGSHLNLNKKVSVQTKKDYSHFSGLDRIYQKILKFIHEANSSCLLFFIKCNIFSPICKFCSSL